MTVIPLSEGVFTIGHDKLFVPFDALTDDLQARPTGSLLVEIQPFLIQLEHELLLLDCGLGFTKNGTLQLHQNLAQHGFSPADVTSVLLSHLHKDHAGGTMNEDEHGRIITALPAATYFVHRKEAEYALQRGLPSYVPSALEPLFSSGQVQWLDGESGTIGQHITWQHSGGHCPWHITFLVEENGQKIFYGGDEAPQLKQLLVRYVAKYDYDGKKAALLRAQYAEQGRREGWKFLFYHDVKKPVVQLPALL